MKQNKTRATQKSPIDFIQAIEDPQKRADCEKIHKMMSEITGAEGKMWGESIIGYGDYHYKYASGREGDWFITGFSPRKSTITLYLSYGFEENEDIMSGLGKYKTGKACLYLKKLDDVNEASLKKLIKKTVDKVSKDS